MPRLNVRLLGPFEVVLDDQPVTAFESDKVRALLAYLATESNQAHRREALAGLLWPEMPERQARMNLRGALADLRQAIDDANADPPFLQVTRQTIQFHLSGDSWIDVQAFDALTGAGEVRKQTVRELEEAVDLHRGAYLQGFSIPDSAGFEEWLTVTREQFTRYALAALDRLAGYHQEQAAYQTAIGFAQRQVELEPTAEAAHRRLIRLLALNGRSAAALEQFEAYRDMLERELGVPPTDDTLELVGRIQRGELRAEARPRLDRAIRGYELREPIGEGNFGAVFRAYQPLVGREVAVKVILPRYANQPEFIRRFEAEAQLVARVEHLHIVPLFDYWREPDGAYLVMRLYRAGSLKQALQQGPWEVEAAARLIDQVTAALMAAHLKGIVHRDVKPANILLDEERNAFLSDFGIAKALDWSSDFDQTGAITGSPAYIAPEQIRNDPVSALTDVYSLGVVLYELLAGAHPFPDQPLVELLNRHLNDPLPALHERRPDLPAAVEQVIQQATAKRPEDRFADAAELASAFRRAVTGNGKPAVSFAPANPYKGLRPFEEADAGEFYGRQALIDQLLSRLEADARFLAVVGPSGSGKSSLVKAGLVPALRRGQLPGSEGWFVVHLNLSERPLQDLEDALTRIAVSPPGRLLPVLREDQLGLLRATRRVQPDAEAKLVLVIDQFEDLFTQVPDGEQRDEFLALLTAAVQDPEGPVRLVLTLRADFYDRPLQHPQFGELVRRNTEVVLRMTPEELERAIVGPLEGTGLEPPGELVAAIIADLADQPGALPLMQYALTELFDLREASGMTLESYRRIGGASGALGRRAEQLYQDLAPAEQAAGWQIFLRLMRLGEGVPDTRQRVRRPDLDRMGLEAADVDAVLDRFGRHRLLTFDRDPESRAPTVELAHEALLREWPRLRGWIDESREGLRRQQRLRRAAEEWEQSDRDPGFLLRGTRLDQFEEWAASTDLALDRRDQEFLEASLAERRSRRAAEARRQAQEAELERRAVRRLRALVVVLALAAVGGFVLSAAAVNAQNAAEAQARIATSREFAGAALANLEVDPERSLLLALEAAEVTRSADGKVLPEVVDALHQALPRTRVRLRLEPAGAAAYSPDGSRIATAGPDEAARVWDSQSGELMLTLRGHSAPVSNAAFSPAGDRLVTGSSDGTTKV